MDGDVHHGRARLHRERFPTARISPNSRSLTTGHIAATSETPAKLLSALIGWFRKSPLDQRIAGSLIAKLAQVIDSEGSVLDRHFGYQAMLQWHYRRRNDDPTALAAAIDACERQIAISAQAAAAMRAEFDGGLPLHKGFEQLAIIREKSGDFDGAIRLAEQADREGWMGDWMSRIDRCRKRRRVRRRAASREGNSSSCRHVTFV